MIPYDAVPLDDRGLLLGDGLFETLLARDGGLILFEEHLARLTAGCETLGLPSPDPQDARRLCEEALTGVPGRAAVRLTLTAGSGGRGLDRPEAPAPRLFATAAPAPASQDPAQLVTVAVRRNEHSPASRLKTLAYLDNVLARRAAAPDEALMLNTAGELACAAASNLFWVMQGLVFTPEIDCGVLPGVMRAQVLARFDVREVRAPRAALDRADGIFLTNSLMGVRAVRALDGRPVSQSPLTAQIAGALADVSSSW